MTADWSGYPPLADAGGGPDPDPVADGMVRAWCGWHIAPQVTETIVIDSQPGRVLRLPSLRVSAVSSVLVDGDPVGFDDYRWSADGMVELVGGCWPAGFRRVQVTLTHGFPTVPWAVASAAATLTASLAAAAPGGRSVKQQTVGPASVTYDSVASTGVMPSPLVSQLWAYRVAGRP